MTGDHKQAEKDFAIPSAEDIANILDVAKVAVDRSSFGPLYVYPDPGDIKKKQIDQLALNLYMAVAAALLSNHVRRTVENEKRN